MSLTDRERDFENRFVHDQELRFRIEARRNKLLGLWAAAKLGRSGGEADDYAQNLVKAAFDRSVSDGVFGTVRRDFEAAGVHQSDHQIRRRMEDLLDEAEAQLKGA